MMKIKKEQRKLLEQFAATFTKEQFEPTPRAEQDDRGAALGQRARAALEQEKNLALRTIKELEFDRAMEKVSEDDFRDMGARLRARASRLIRELDALVRTFGDRLDKTVRERVDLALVLGESGPLVVEPQPQVEVDAHGKLDLDIGVNLDSAETYLLPSTTIAATASMNAQIGRAHV